MYIAEKILSVILSAINLFRYSSLGGGGRGNRYGIYSMKFTPETVIGWNARNSRLMVPRIPCGEGLSLRTEYASFTVVSTD